MKNVVLKVALGLSLASAAALAQGAFVGVEGDYSFGSKLKVKRGDGSKDSIKKAQPGLGIKAGYDFDNFRAYGAYFYNFQTKKELEDDGEKYTIKWNKHSFLAGADYTPSITSDVKLVAGAYTGVSRIKFKVDNSDSAQHSTGFVLGTKFGAEYLLDQNNILEAGVKADYTFYRKIEEVKVRESNIGLYVGYTYKF